MGHSVTNKYNTRVKKKVEWGRYAVMLREGRTPDRCRLNGGGSECVVMPWPAPWPLAGLPVTPTPQWPQYTGERTAPRVFPVLFPFSSQHAINHATWCWLTRLVCLFCPSVRWDLIFNFLIFQNFSNLKIFKTFKIATVLRLFGKKPHPHAKKINEKLQIFFWPKKPSSKTWKKFARGPL